MNATSRRRFLIQSGQLGAAVFARTCLPRRAFANPRGRPVGIQLYTVKEAMLEDPEGTLKKLREFGYGEVESAGLGKRTAKEFRQLLDAAGLACPSAHLSFDIDDLGPTFEAAHALGATYVVSGSLPAPAAAPAAAAAAASKSAAAPAKRSMSLDEAKRTADLVNRLGDAAHRAGLQYAYHNHDFEFVDQGGGAIGYDVLLRESDPKLVKFEIDCGWMIFAGRNPIDYFKKYPNRFPMIHVKDFLPGSTADMLGAELGRGVVDYKPIFAAAATAGLRHYFVEQEGPFSRMDPLRAAGVDYKYLHAIA